jgi:hypothetical protein
MSTITLKKQNNQQQYYQPMKKSNIHLKSPGMLIVLFNNSNSNLKTQS